MTCVLAGPHMANGGISVKQNMSLSPPSSELPVETDALESWTGAVRADERAAVGQPEPNPLGEQQNTLPGSPCAPVGLRGPPWALVGSRKLLWAPVGHRCSYYRNQLL